MLGVRSRRAAALVGALGVAGLVLTLGSGAASGAFIDSGGKGKRSPLRSAAASNGPSKPGKPGVVAATDSTVTISWRKSSGRTVVGYHVYRDDVRVASTVETRFTHTDLRCGTSYQLGVEAYDRSGKRSARVEILAATAACTDTTPPTTPADVTQVGVTPSSITLSWVQSRDDFGVVGYEVLRDGDVAATTTATLYSVSSLRCGTMYTIGIRALDAAGNRSPAAAVLMTTAPCPDTTAPSDPGGLAVTAVNETSVSISWSPSADDLGVQGYGVYRGSEAIGSTASTTYIVAGLDCGTSYIVGVDAYDAAGNRSGRSSLTAATSPCPPPPDDPDGDTTPPSAPLGLTVTGATAQSISLAWAASTDDTSVVGYGLYRDGASVGSVSLPSATLSGLTCGRSYDVRIDAYDAAGNRSVRSAVIASTAPCPDTAPPSIPSGLTQTGVSETTVALSWTPSTDNVGVAGYSVYVAGIRVGSVASPGYTFSALTCGTTYVVGVDAYDAIGNRSEQTTMAVTTRSCVDTEAPSLPSDQKVSEFTQSSFTMTWGAATDNVGVAGYAVYLDGAKVGTTTETRYVYTGLDCGRTYIVGLEAFDAAGNASSRAHASGPATTSACSSSTDTVAPSTPVGLTASGQTSDAITVSWTPSTDNVGVSGYGNYRDGVRVGNGSGTTYSFTGLTCGSSYLLAVDSYDAAGNRSAPASISASTAPCTAPSPPASGLAHLWIDGNGGTCSRASVPTAYNDAAACGTAFEAYAVANATSEGSTILIRGGTYSRFRIYGNRTSSNWIVFDAAPGETPVFTGGYISVDSDGVSTRGPDYVVLRNLTAAQFGAGAKNPDNRYGVYIGPGSTHIRLENMRAGNFLIQAAQNIDIVGGEFGPCRAADERQDCEINKVDHYPDAPQPMNILIDGVYFHDYDLGPSCFTPSNGGTSTGSPDCHWRAMYLNGVHNLTLRNSRFRESFIAPWTTISGPGAARVGNKNILIENNVFGTGVNYGNPGNYNNRGYGRWESFDFAWCQNASSGVYGYDNITYRFNSSSRSTGVFVLFNQSGCQGKVRDVKVYGNVGFRNGCDPLVEYRYNVYSNSGTCHTTDVALGTGALPFYSSDTHSPGADDYMLVGALAAPDNLVPAGQGCPTTDRTGRSRGVNGYCDAGAYER